MTTRSLILSPHEVRAALVWILGLVVRPVRVPEKRKGEHPCLCHYSPTMWGWGDEYNNCTCAPVACPLGVPGDRLRCKEGWADVNTESGPAVTYRADNGLHFCQDDAFPIEYDRYPGMKFTMWCGDLWRGEPDHSWRSPATMPAWASRITMEVVGVRCVRLESLTNMDAINTGIPEYLNQFKRRPYTEYEDDLWRNSTTLENMRRFWESKYGTRYPWGTSWAWAVEVRRMEE